jgi:hypothetical protein
MLRALGLLRLYFSESDHDPNDTVQVFSCVPLSRFSRPLICTCKLGSESLSPHQSHPRITYARQEGTRIIGRIRLGNGFDLRLVRLSKPILGCFAKKVDSAAWVRTTLPAPLTQVRVVNQQTASYEGIEA